MSGIRIGIYLAAALALGWATWRIVDQVATGRVSKATEIYNQENRDAADAVAEARQRVRACHAAGRLWDRQAGQCLGPMPSPGK